MNKVIENKKKLKFKYIITAILIIIFIICDIYIINYYYKSYKTEITYNELMLSNFENISEEQYGQIVEELQTTNEDIIGWITIEGTKINYPLLQGEDNEYYLEHNFKNEKDKYGSIYLNNQSNFNDLNSNVIIYGHNMSDDKMFGELLKYVNYNFYLEHPYIKISVGNKIYTYEIITVFKSKVYSQNQTNVFKYYNYHNLGDDKKYNEYIKNCKDTELYNIDKQAQHGQQLITLTTCEYSTANGRLGIVAKRMK